MSGHRIRKGVPAWDTFRHSLGWFRRREAAPKDLEQNASGVMFCQACCQLLREISSTPCNSGFGLRDHHQSYLAYDEAVASGCRLCTRLSVQDKGTGECRLYCYYVWLEESTSSSIEYSLRPPLEIKFLSNLPDARPGRFYILPALPDLEKASCEPYSPANNTGSKESFTLASHWLEKCANSHRSCNYLRPASLQEWNPTRLVFVGTQDDHALRLCEGSALHPRIRYLTLSHCWGTDPQRTVLTKHNIASWINEIPRSELMQTFKDAIDVTRALGIQYLWIDSLCIIQDSESDWLHESSSMSEVYKFSYCNIAAAHASSDAIGLFVERKPPQCAPVCFGPSDFESNILNEPVDDDRSGVLFEGPYSIDKYGKAWEDLRDSPLYKRAWVVQERILSPRLLHFAGDQLFWECNELRTCELFPGEMPRSIWPFTGLQDRKIFDFNRQSPMAMSPQTNTISLESEFPSETIRPPMSKCLHIWTGIIETYTDCQLTKEADKLIAISAIARAMKPLVECRYLAGLWEKDLAKQLGWCVGDGDIRRPTTYRAPSWSWASVEGPCQFNIEPMADPLIEIRSAHVDLASDNEMGPVKGGHLDVTGQLFALDKNPREYCSTRIHGHDVRFPFYQDDPLTDINGPLYLLPLTISSDDMAYVEFTALVLQQYDHQACYQRVGSAVETRLASRRREATIPKVQTAREIDEKVESFLRNDSQMQHIRLV